MDKNRDRKKGGAQGWSPFADKIWTFGLMVWMFFVWPLCAAQTAEPLPPPSPSSPVDEAENGVSSPDQVPQSKEPSPPIASNGQEDEMDDRAQQWLQQGWRYRQQQEEFFRRIDALYEEGVRLYHEGRWLSARDVFLEIQEIVPDHRRTRLYLDDIKRRLKLLGIRVESRTDDEDAKIQNPSIR